MMRGSAAGAAYFAIVFAVGFALGTGRTLLLEPRMGGFAAVLLETPFMLVASWLACGWLIRRLAVGAETSARLAMASVAFALLATAEAAFDVLAFGRSLFGHFALYGQPAGALGLAGQIVFGLFPLFVSRTRRLS